MDQSFYTDQNPIIPALTLTFYVVVSNTDDDSTGKIVIICQEMSGQNQKERGSVFRYWKEKLRKCQYHKLQYVKSES